MDEPGRFPSNNSLHSQLHNSFQKSSATSYKQRKPVPPGLLAETPTTPKPHDSLMSGAQHANNHDSLSSHRQRVSSLPSSKTHSVSRSKHTPGKKRRTSETYILHTALEQRDEMTERLRKAEEDKLALEKRLERMESRPSTRSIDSSSAMLRKQQSETIAAQEQASQYRLRLQAAEKELYSAREALQSMEGSKRVAENEAREARSIARYLKAERDVRTAREDGWNRGVAEGRQLARELLREYNLPRQSPHERPGGQRPTRKYPRIISDAPSTVPDIGSRFAYSSDDGQVALKSQGAKHTSQRGGQRSRTKSLDPRTARKAHKHSPTPPAAIPHSTVPQIPVDKAHDNSKPKVRERKEFSSTGKPFPRSLPSEDSQATAQPKGHHSSTFHSTNDRQNVPPIRQPPVVVTSPSTEEPTSVDIPAPVTVQSHSGVHDKFASADAQKSPREEPPPSMASEGRFHSSAVTSPPQSAPAVGYQLNTPVDESHVRTVEPSVQSPPPPVDPSQPPAAMKLPASSTTPSHFVQTAPSALPTYSSPQLPHSAQSAFPTIDPSASTSAPQPLRYIRMPAPPVLQTRTSATPVMIPPPGLVGRTPAPRFPSGEVRSPPFTSNNASASGSAAGMGLFSFPAGAGSSHFSHHGTAEEERDYPREQREAIVRRVAELKEQEARAERVLRNKFDRLGKERDRQTSEFQREQLGQHNPPTIPGPHYGAGVPGLVAHYRAPGDADKRRSVEEWRRHTIPDPENEDAGFLSPGGSHLDPSGADLKRRPSQTSTTSVGITIHPPSPPNGDHEMPPQMNIPVAPGGPPVIPGSFADAAFGPPGAQLPPGFVPSSPYRSGSATLNQPDVAFSQPTMPTFIPPPGTYETPPNANVGVTGGRPIMQASSSASPRPGSRGIVPPGTPSAGLITPRPTYEAAPLPQGLEYPSASALSAVLAGQTSTLHPHMAMPQPQIDRTTTPVIPGVNTGPGLGTPNRRSMSLNPAATPSSLTSSLPGANFPTDRKLRHTSKRISGQNSSSSSSISSTSESDDEDDDGVDRFDATTTRNTLVNSMRYTPAGGPIALPGR